MVLDASALLAFLHDEPGAGIVRAEVNGGIVSVVNWAEVLQKSRQRGVNVTGMQEEIAQSGLLFEPFTLTHAEKTAELYIKTRAWGLSLADRACLALAMERSAPVLTADRVWAELDLDVQITLLR